MAELKSRQFSRGGWENLSVDWRRGSLVAHLGVVRPQASVRSAGSADAMTRCTLPAAARELQTEPGFSYVSEEERGGKERKGCTNRATATIIQHIFMLLSGEAYGM